MASKSPASDGGLGQNRVVGAMAVLLIAVAVIVVVQMYRNSQPHPVKFLNLPPGSSEKAQAMRAQGKAPFGEQSASELIGGGSGSPKR